MRSVADKIARFESYAPVGETLERRFADVGATALHWALVGDTMGLLRLAIAEASRFPDLATSVHRMTRERAREAVSRLLSEAAQSDEFERLPAFAPERLATTTGFYQALVILPLIMRALYGEPLDALRAEIEPHVAQTVTFFLAACRCDSARVALCEGSTRGRSGS